METITKIKVRNFMSSRSYAEVPNQFEITTPEGVYFQSYQSIIAFKSKDGSVYLDADKWDYSVTTSKYRNQFLNDDTKGVKERIKSGYYKLVNLN